MAELKFLDNTYSVNDFGTVLNTLLKHGHAVPNSCRGGHCHSCLMRSLKGAPVAFSQMGLKKELVDEKYFLACQCMVYYDMTVAMPAKDKRTRFPAMVEKITPLSDEVVRVLLRPVRDFAYKSGQYITLRDVNEVEDDYPVASVQDGSGLMEFHIQRGGKQALDRYITEELGDNDALEVQTSFTDSHYNEKNTTHTLVLVAVDAHVAGAIGLAREALHKGHTGAIHILHHRKTMASSYAAAVVEEMQQKHSNLFFHDSTDVAGSIAAIEGSKNAELFLWGFSSEEQAAVASLAGKVIAMVPYE
jgi:NAD(P)H-flavin reductase/ferredoxin